MQECRRCHICKLDHHTENILTKNCHHTICDFCLHQEVLYNFNSLKSKANNNSVVNLRCYTCGARAANKITKQDIIKRTSNEQSKAEKSKCKYKDHQLELIKYCIDCKWEMCCTCIELHDELPFENHMIIESKNGVMFCSKEDGNLSAFQCLDCNKPYCRLCSSGEHKNHKLKPIDEYCKEIKEKLNNLKLPLIENSYQRKSSELVEYFTNMNSNIDKLVNFLNSYKTDPYVKLAEFEDRLKSNDYFSLLFEKLKTNIQTVDDDDYTKLTLLNKLPKEYTLPEIPCDFITPKFKLIENFANSFLPISEIKKTSQINNIEKSPININSIPLNPKLVTNNHYVMEYVNLGMSLSEGITCMVLLKDGRIASGSDDKLIRIYDMDSKEVKFLNGHSKKVTSIILLDNDTRLASASSDSSIIIWDIKHMRITKSLINENANDNGDHPLCLLSLPDGKLAAGKKNNTIEIWNYDSLSEKPIKILKGHKKSINCLLLLKNHNFISGSDDGTIRVWNCQDKFECVKKIRMNPLQSIYSLLEIKEGELAIGLKRNLIIHNLEKEEEYDKTLTCHGSKICSLLLLPDGNLLSASKNRTINIWDLNNKSLLHTEFKVMPQHLITCLLLTKNGNIVCCSEGDKTRLLILKKYEKEFDDNN